MDPPPLRMVPRQRRARRTVDEFCDASAQLLTTQGPRGFTTNHVAARAGYSIGTLYRWFPDKQVLLATLAQREVGRQEAAVRAVLAAAPPGLGVEGLARIVVRAVMRPAMGERLRQALFLLLPAGWPAAAARAALPAVLPLLIEAVRHHGGLTVEGAVSAPIDAMVAATHQPALFASAAFEDAMVRLVTDCLAPA